MNTTLKNRSDLGAMKALEIGQSVSFPIRSICSIRTNASIINSIRGCKSLSTSSRRDKGIITVTRIA